MEVKMKDLGKFVMYPDKIIGQGSFGYVCEGFEKDRPEFKVAIKVVPSEKIPEEADKIMLLNEIKSLINFELNENVVKLYNAVRTPNNFYLFMEYCDGGNLTTYASTFPGKKIPEADVRKIMKDIVNGFESLRENKIVHRDIKPENILRSGGKWKLADFGFSRQLDEGEKAQTLVGSPFFMAPQIITTQGNYTNKCDIWSLGALIYFLLVGQYPFTASTLEALAKTVTQTSVYYPAGVPEDLKELMQDMFKVNESERLEWKDLFRFDWKA
eukprot:TRINITY_DN4346_c0_g2_i3.p1 TRINITY_DN4346_c0_g2~~TRINITY_DN4346_c0_g2_i3.p1  ORF type:complete len:270 (-),score=58.53 TRINITY_DN4346_c0_g2_i3:72-881(-)